MTSSKGYQGINMGFFNNNTCRLCKDETTKESQRHILWECKTLEAQRNQISLLQEKWLEDGEYLAARMAKWWTEVEPVARLLQEKFASEDPSTNEDHRSQEEMPEEADEGL